MKPPSTISKERPKLAVEDYAALRELGLRYIEQFASDLWTDYNTHDPGITILETLCYAITDLGNRTSYPIPDLLASKKNNLDNMHGQFLSAARVLACGSVTKTDYRKLILDMPEVKNVWISKANISYTVDCTDSVILRNNVAAKPEHRTDKIAINGLYNIRLELDEGLSNNRKSTVIKEVKALYHRHRNLGEDLHSVSQVQQQGILLCVDLELSHDADIESVWAQMLFDIEQYLTPNIKRYSVADLLKKGKSPEAIFDGPLLKNGFIDDDELRAAELRDKVYVADITRVIMNVPGVEAIRKLFINYADRADRPVEGEYKWCLDIKDNHQPILDQSVSTFNFYKDQLPFVPFTDEMQQKLKALHEQEQDQLTAIAATLLDLPMPLGTYRDTKSYSSLQNDLPQAYGVGLADLSAGASPKREGQARQLKAYLLFFDQILANYFAQLSNLKHLLSADNAHRKSYFTQLVSDIKGLDDLYFDTEQMDSILTEVTAERDDTQASDLFTERKNKLLDHLLARFAENMSDYVLVMHKMFSRKRADRELIRDKITFLQEYQSISQNRARAFDYCNLEGVDSAGNSYENKIWYSQDDVNIPTDQVNVAGVVQRVARLSGIHNFKRRNLAHVEYDIYEEADNDDESELRWRVIDSQNEKILLSGSTKYESEAAGLDEMRTSIDLALFFENYQLLETKDGRFYFNIINTEDEVVARRIEYFRTPDLRMNAIEYLIDFLNEKYSDEGFYVIENTLLRPRKNSDIFLPICTDDACKICATLDPYSFRVNIIFPGYTPRFSNMDFRQFMERTIRAELPAHILARICWIGQNQMADLEIRYREWLEYNQDRCGKQQQASNNTLNNLIDLLGELYTVYPPGTLHDCIDGDDENPIVLGRTHIGNQREIIESRENDDPPEPES